jgi:hypothetical protein
VGFAPDTTAFTALDAYYYIMASVWLIATRRNRNLSRRGVRTRPTFSGFKNGTSAWHRTKTSSLNRAVDYCYPTLVKDGASGGCLPRVIRFGRSMPECSATDAFEIGRVPRCCPGCLPLRRLRR